MVTLKILKVTSIFVRELLREPLGVFWSAIFPLMLFGFLVFDRLGDVDFDYRIPAALMLAYIAITNALFGFSLYLVGRRESGFLKMFIQSPSQKKIFLLAQGGASLIMTLAYMIFFIIAVFISCPIGLSALLSLLPGALAGALVIQFSALALSVLPVTHATASSVLSMTLTPLILASLFSASGAISGPLARTLFNMNPILVVQRMAMGWSYIDAGCLSVLAILVVLGAFGYSRMQVNPIWSRQ